MLIYRSCALIFLISQRKYGDHSDGQIIKAVQKEGNSFLLVINQPFIN